MKERDLPGTKIIITYCLPVGTYVISKPIFLKENEKLLEQEIEDERS